MEESGLDQGQNQTINKYKMLGNKKTNIKTKLQLTGGTTSISIEVLVVLADDCDALCGMG